MTNAHTEQVPTRTVLAQLPGSSGGQVIMLGAHLDSVIDGPGINDNASGVAALLEIARALRGTRPQATVRMAFWSGEELGLHGSLRYVDGPVAEQRDAIVVYTNVDMIASLNGFAGVYDEPAAPVSSSRASGLLSAAVTRNGGTPVQVDLHSGSDHYGFVEAGIATAGVFSGFLDPVSEAQAVASGAEAGRPADDCYHQPCDDLDEHRSAPRPSPGRRSRRLHGPGGEQPGAPPGLTRSSPCGSQRWWACPPMAMYNCRDGGGCCDTRTSHNESTDPP